MSHVFNFILAFVITVLFHTSLSQERCNEPIEHICKTNGACIKAQYVCDGKWDCGDGSDETSDLCLSRPCSQVFEHRNRSVTDIITIGHVGNSQNFECDYGACIPFQAICNGIEDCADGSDEFQTICGNNTCESSKFQCDYGGCISISTICNSIVNCHDGSDETEKVCKKFYRPCPVRTGFRCKYGACIGKSKKCDGRANCLDNSDELDCGPNHNYKPFRTIFRGIGTTNTEATTTSSVPIAGSSTGCPSTNPPQNSIMEVECGSLDSILCGTSGLMPFYTYISGECDDGSFFDLECQLDGLWHSDDPGRSPSNTICLGDATSNVVAECDLTEVPERILICGKEGSCRDNPTTLPIGSFILSKCNDPKGYILECRSDTFWHSHHELIAPTYRSCHTPKSGCLGSSSPGSFEVLVCGHETRDCNEQKLPTNTIILANCGKPVPLILQCHSDDLWHPLGENSGPPMPAVCQYESPNLKTQTDCGKLSGDVTSTGFSWLWLVGLFRNNKFACTGTLVSPTLIITAGHCVARSQASVGQDIISANELLIQHAVPGGKTRLAAVHSIRVHPRYSGGKKPHFDLALVRLRHAAFEIGKLLPACIDTEGRFIGKETFVFNRTEGDEAYLWTPFTQRLDTSCYNRGSLCSRHLNIDDYQFCGVNEGSSLFLHPGSSGGPYLINLGSVTKEKWAIAGVVSHSVRTKDDLKKCKKPHVVFLSVNKFVDWILKCGYADDCF